MPTQVSCTNLTDKKLVQIFGLFLNKSVSCCYSCVPQYDKSHMLCAKILTMGEVPNLSELAPPLIKIKWRSHPPCFKKSAEITKTVQFCIIFNFKVTIRNTYCQHKRKNSVALFNFHTLVVIGNKPSDFFVAAYLKLPALTLAVCTRLLSHAQSIRRVPTLVFQMN